MKKKTFSLTEEKEMCEWFQNGKTNLSIRKEFGITFLNLKSIFEKYEIKNCYKKQTRKPRFKSNFDFFEKIDSEAKAYWLGFIYADGYITGKQLGISIHQKDIDLLYQFKKDINSENNINKYENNTAFGKTAYCRIAITSEKLVKDLINKGVFYNKTNIIKFPTKEQVPEDLIHHFIRGYFDGDGSIIKPSKGKTQYRISFLGTNEFLTELRKKMNIETKTKFSKRKPTQTVEEFKFGGNKKVKEAKNFLYKNATIYLKRKKEVFDKVVTFFNDYTVTTQTK